jgi:hypothetical protein
MAVTLTPVATNAAVNDAKIAIQKPLFSVKAAWISLAGLVVAGGTDLLAALPYIHDILNSHWSHCTEIISGVTSFLVIMFGGHLSTTRSVIGTVDSPST